METTNWGTKKEAIIAERELERRVKEKFSPTTLTNLDLVSLSNRYLKSLPDTMNANTKDAKLHFCKDVLKRWGNIIVADLKVYQVLEYLEEKIRKVSVNSFNVYRNHDMTMIKWAIKQQLLPRDTLNVFESIPLRPYQKKEKGAAPIDIVLQVIAVADAEQKDLLLAYLLTGARKTELLTMVWADIDFDNRTYLLHTKKSGTGLAKTTRHNMSELLYALFRRKLDSRHLELEHVFWHRYFSRKHGGHIDGPYTSISKMAEHLCKRGGTGIRFAPAATPEFWNFIRLR